MLTESNTSQNLRLALENINNLQICIIPPGVEHNQYFEKAREAKALNQTWNNDYVYVRSHHQGNRRCVMAAEPFVVLKIHRI